MYINYRENKTINFQNNGQNNEISGVLLILESRKLTVLSPQ